MAALGLAGHDVRCRMTDLHSRVSKPADDDDNGQSARL